MKLFKIIHKDLGDRGQMRFSSSDGEARIQARTNGIALKYVLKGKEHYEIGSEQVDLRPGRFIILPQDVCFKAMSKEATTKGICLDLSFSEVTDAIPDIESIHLLFGVAFHTLNHLELGKTIRQMESVLDSDRVNDPINDLYDALVEFCQLVNSMQEGLNKAYSKANSKQQVLLRLLLARDYIFSNYSGPLKLDTLSSAIGISKSHLQRLFTACFHVSPKKLQQNLRMNKAMELIATDNYSLKDIAFELGYSDLAAFSNQFRACHLISPKEYRALIA